MVLRRRAFLSVGLLSMLALLFLPASARQSKTVPSALAPLEIVAEDLGHLRGIVVDGTGAAFVTDSRRGRLLRVATDGRAAVVLERLKRPRGLAINREGRLVVVEAGRRRVLRLEADGGTTALASGLKQPRWVGAGPAGDLYVTARSLGHEGEDGDEDEAEPEVIARLALDGRVGVFADRFRGLGGLAVVGGVVEVTARGRRGDRHPTGVLYEIPIQPDGRAGEAHTVVMNEVIGPAGLAVDRLGGRFVAARSLAGQPRRGDVIVKVDGTGAPSLFAGGLQDAQGLAFGPDGSLYATDGDSGRILRFIAPPAPSLEEAPPAVTNQPQITLRLRGAPGARVTVLGGELPVVTAVDAAGSAAVSVPLNRNAGNQLLAFVTGSGGLGLASAPLVLDVAHDAEPPALELLAPRAGALLRGTIAVEARAADANGIADVEFRLDDSTVGLDAVEPFRVSVDTRVVVDGPRVVSALARDRAGNVGRASARVTVDNTAPQVRIAAPATATGAIAAGAVEVVVEATDAVSGVALVELAVNGVPRFLAEAPPYRFELESSDLVSGANVLVAAAVDRAGNRGESPPVSISRSGLTVEISEPADGAQVAPGLVLVRGRVESRDDVGVAINGLPAAVEGNTFAALVPVDGTTTSLTAVATTATGLTASHTLVITITPAAPGAATLRASPASGVAPLTVRFSVVGPAAVAIELDFDGDGVGDFSGPRLNGETFTYTQPGVYFPVATITDSEGRRITANGVVRVFDPTALDRLLQDRWRAMKDALRAGDIPRAVTHITARTRADYEAAFNIIAAQLPNIDSILADIALIEVRNASAIYEMTRVDDGLPMSFGVRFAIDGNGLWRVEAF